jgi:hypothetical protein
VAWQVHYRRAGERDAPAFTDRGKEIAIHESTRRESETGFAGRQESARRMASSNRQ